MQIEQHWIIPQTVSYSEQKKIENNKYYEETTELEKYKVRFHLNIDVRKEMAECHKTTDNVRKSSTEF